jgi:hypothetical protein
MNMMVLKMLGISEEDIKQIQLLFEQGKDLVKEFNKLKMDVEQIKKDVLVLLKAEDEDYKTLLNKLIDVEENLSKKIDKMEKYIKKNLPEL